MRIIDKIFGDKKSTSLIYILLAAGIVMLVCSNVSVDDEAQQVQEGNVVLSENREVRTERILSEIKGVGEVSVMISFEKNCEDDSADVFGGEKSSGTADAVDSVLIVADGGSNAAVREQIVRAAKAALGVDAHKIEVFERKE